MTTSQYPTLPWKGESETNGWFQVKNLPPQTYGHGNNLTPYNNSNIAKYRMFSGDEIDVNNPYALKHNEAGGWGNKTYFQRSGQDEYGAYNGSGKLFDVWSDMGESTLGDGNIGAGDQTYYDLSTYTLPEYAYESNDGAHEWQRPFTDFFPQKDPSHIDSWDQICIQTMNVDSSANSGEPNRFDWVIFDRDDWENAHNYPAYNTYIISVASSFNDLSYNNVLGAMSFNSDGNGTRPILYGPTIKDATGNAILATYHNILYAESRFVSTLTDDSPNFYKPVEKGLGVFIRKKTYDSSITTQPLSTFEITNNTTLAVDSENKIVFGSSYGNYKLNVGSYTVVNNTSYPFMLFDHDSEKINVIGGTIVLGDLGFGRTGTFQINVLDDFGTVSYKSANHGFMGGKNNLVFDSNSATGIPISPLPNTPWKGSTQSNGWKQVMNLPKQYYIGNNLSNTITNHKNKARAFSGNNIISGLTMTDNILNIGTNTYYQEGSYGAMNIYTDYSSDNNYSVIGDTFQSGENFTL